MTSHKSRQTCKAWLKSQKKTTHPLWEMGWMVICHHNKLNNIFDMILHIPWPVCGYITLTKICIMSFWSSIINFTTTIQPSAPPLNWLQHLALSWVKPLHPPRIVIGIPSRELVHIHIPYRLKKAPFKSMSFRTSSSVGCCWWRKSCEPVEVDSLAHYLQGFIHPGFPGLLPSTKCQECHTSPLFCC